MTSPGPGWVGHTLGKRYKIESVLGRGGMSSVYRAHDPNLNRKVAIKIIHQHLTDNVEFIQRFEQEAALIAQLRHPNIIQVHDFNHEGNAYYMVMEFIPGETLSHRLEKIKKADMRLPLPDTVHIMTQIGAAVEYAHRQGMIHRDLKPANVMIDLMGEPILMDFGIAKMVGTQSQMTSGIPLGTAAFMSPEQVQGGISDHRSDIYSLGIMLYELVSGELPFDGDTTYQIMVKQVNDAVPDIQEVASNTPAPLVSILMAALAKDPDDRFQSAAEMSSALQAVSSELEESAESLPSEHQGQMGALWQEARDQFDERKWGACLATLADLQKVDPEYQAKKVSQLREEALDRLNKQAQREYASGNFAESLAVIETIHKFEPELLNEELEIKVRQGMQNAERRSDLDNLYQTAVTHLEARDYEQALADWGSIQEQKGDMNFPDRQLVEKRAQEGFCAACYANGLTAVAAKNPEEAQHYISQIMDIDPQYPHLAQLEEETEGLIRALNRPWYQQSQVWAGAIIITGFLMVFLLFSTRIFNERTGVTPSPTIPLIAIGPTATETATLPASATPTGTRQPTSTATISPSATHTPSAEPTISPSNTPPSPPQDRARVTDNVSLFTLPDASSNELAVISAGTQVWVLARSETGNWLFVSDDFGRQGFAIISRLEWPGDITALPVRSELVADADPTSESAPNNGDIMLDLFQLDDSEVCEGDGWSMMIFIEGHGDGTNYTYYWDDELLVENHEGGYTFKVSSSGGPIIGTGEVISTNDIASEKELFLPRPNCN